MTALILGLLSFVLQGRPISERQRDNECGAYSCLSLDPDFSPELLDNVMGYREVYPCALSFGFF